LRAAAEELLPRGILGKDLAGLEQGWGTLLDEEPDADVAYGRGERLFELAARLLGAGDPQIPAAGRLFAHSDLLRRGMARFAPPPAEQLRAHRFGRRLRPLTALARLAARDAGKTELEGEATPARATTLLSHRLFGTVPLPY
jgi:phytoene synthase